MSSVERQFRLADIELKKSKRNESITHVFRFESTTRGKRGPVGLVVAEIYSTLYVYEQLLEVIEQTAEQTHFVTSGGETDPMARFEKLVQRVNDRVAEFLKHEPSPIAWGRVNIFLVELSDGHVSVTGVGRLSNIFLQKQTDGTMRGFDLLSSLEQPEDLNPEKPFASILCGDMNPGDVLFIGTQNFERFRQSANLIQTLSQEPPVSAAITIRKALDIDPTAEDFSGVIISHIELPVPEHEQGRRARVDVPETSTASIQRLHEEEQKTEAMLSPTITPLPFGVPKEEEELSSRPIGMRVRLFVEAQRTWIRDLLEDLQKKKPKIEDPVALASLRGMNAGHGSFMTSERKRILYGFGAGVLVLVIGIAWYRHAQTASQEQAVWKVVYDQIQDKKTRAEADLVYGNDDRAYSLVKESVRLLDEMDTSTKDRAQAVTDLRASIQNLLGKIKRETILTNLTEVHAIGTQDTVSSIAVARKTVFALDPTTRTITAVQADGTKQSTPIPESYGTPNTLVGANDTLYLFTKEGGAYTLKSNGILNAIPFEARAGTTSTLTGVIYNKRLYRLDEQTRTVWRHNPQGAGFGNGTAYIKQHATEISDATGLAIDTNVYLSTQHGALVRFISGQEETWIARVTEPAVTTIAGVWTMPEVETVYVTDPANKRIISYRKSDGKLMDQFSSAEWSEPTHITGDPTTKTLYVTDKNRVIKIKLP